MSLGLCIRSMTTKYRLQHCKRLEGFRHIIGPNRKEVIAHAMTRRKALPLYTYAGSRDLNTITTAINTAAKQKGIKLVIIDYLQLIELQDENANLHAKLSKISSALKACVTQNNITIIALSTLKKPTNATLIRLFLAKYAC